MRATKDFPNIDPTPQKEPLAFDFYPYLPIGVTLTGTPTVTAEVADVSEVDDPSPLNILDGAPTRSTVSPPDGAGVANTAVIQFVSNCQPGVTYLIRATCTRSDTGVASMWAHMKCVDPH